MANYLIKPGDTLSGIAQQTGADLATIQNLNPNITNPNMIQAGQTLNLPDTQPQTQPQQQNMDYNALAQQLNQLQGQFQNIQTQAQNVQPSMKGSPDLSTPPIDYNNQQSQIQQAIQSSGVDLNNAGDVRSVANDATSMSDTNAQAESELKQFQSLLQQKISSFNDPNSQNANYQAYYNTLAEQQGLPAIDTSVVNLQNMILGTEDDIRKEISAGGGVATESQIQALVATRNKVLTNELNAQLNLQKEKTDYVNNQVALYKEDRNDAATNFDKLFGYQDKITSLQNTIDNSGFKNTIAYQNFLQKEQSTALTQLKNYAAMGTLGSLDDGTIQYYADTLGIDPSLIKLAGTNTDAKFELTNQLNNARSQYYNAGFANLSPDDVSNLATMFINGYPVQNLFKGFAANGYIGQILTQAMGNLNSSGTTVEDVITNSSNYKALSTALTNEQKRLASINTYEGAVKAQIPIVQDTFKAYQKASGNKSESLVFNEAYQYFTGALTGVKAQQIKPFYLALDRMATEWAKVTSGSLGAAEVSMTAAQKMRDLLNPASGPATLKGLLDVVQRDMDAQKTGSSQSIKTIQDQLAPYHPDTGYPTTGVSQEVNDYVNSLGK